MYETALLVTTISILLKDGSSMRKCRADPVMPLLNFSSLFLTFRSCSNNKRRKLIEWIRYIKQQDPMPVFYTADACFPLSVDDLASHESFPPPRKLPRDTLARLDCDCRKGNTEIGIILLWDLQPTGLGPPGPMHRCRAGIHVVFDAATLARPDLR